MNSVGAVPNENPIVTFFAIGMGIGLFLIYCVFMRNKSFEEDKSAEVSRSRECYKRLEDQVRDSWSKLLRNNRLYLGAMIIGFGAQKFGQISGHPIFGSSLVIAFTYLLVFTSSFKQFVNGRILDQQVIACSLKGLQMEREHPEWRFDFFHRFTKENCQGYGMFSVAFFRVIILSWLLFCVIDFGILSRFEESWSQLTTSLLSVAIFVATASFLWKVGCRPYYSLGARSKEALA
jgi:hypothetical protein